MMTTLTRQFKADARFAVEKHEYCSFVIGNDTYKIGITDRAVDSRMMQFLVPDGRRQISLAEAVEAYVHSRPFRKMLHNDSVWVRHNGLDTAGYKEILDDYSFRTVSRSKFYKLPEERRSFHNKGGGAVTIDSMFGGGCLNISTWHYPSAVEAKIAYVVDKGALDHDGRDLARFRRS
jgi:hypothetical protein